MFSRLDTNKDGYIDKCELLKGFPQLEDETVDHFIAGADADRDGSISFEELFAVIQSVGIEGQRGSSVPVQVSRPSGLLLGLCVLTNSNRLEMRQ